MRVFAAMEVPGQVVDGLTAFQRELKGSGADLKLVERENLHFTVKFLGEIAPAQAKEADARLRGLSLKAATVEVKGVGAFPGPSRPRVVWAGAEEREGDLLSTVKLVIAALDGIGERDDRPFTLHLTLARVRSDRSARGLQEAISKNAERSFGLARVTAVKLKSSQLGPSGPVYTDIGAYPLS